MFKHIFLTNKLQALNLFYLTFFSKRPLIAHFSSNAPQLPISIPSPPEGRYRPKGAISPTVENDWSKRLIERVKQHIPLKLQGMIGTPAASNESPSSAIGAHFVESPECWSKYTTDRFGIVSFARTDCHLKALESLYISGQKPVLCRQKRFIYSCILFKHFSC